MRFCLVFDFDTNILAQQYYQFTANNSWRNAYTVISLLLTGIGWTHVQGTVYFSQNNANLGEIVNLVNSLRPLQYLRPALRNIMVFEMSGETDIMFPNGRTVHGQSSGQKLDKSWTILDKSWTSTGQSSGQKKILKNKLDEN